jgi:hypothetical protein
MAGYVQTFKQRFPDKIKPQMVQAYHGGTSKISEFSDKQVHDNEGDFPGIYFTTDENSARKMGPYVTKAQIDMNRTVSPQTPPKRADVQYMILHAPDKDESMKKYGDVPRDAYFKAMDYVLNGKNARSCFHRVATEFYKDNNDVFVSNMIKCGYDGMAVEREKETYYIVFNPKTIEIVKQ